MSFAAFGFNMLDKLATNSSNLFGTGDRLKERERKDARYDYAENERAGIQARVEGAKAAGLHPLAALGFQAGPGPTSVISGTSDAPSQRFPDPISQERSDPNIERFNAARARQMEAEADMAELNAHNAYRALATQPGQAPPGQALLPTDPRNRPDSTPRGGLNGVRIVPDEVTAGVLGRTAGTHPSATDFAIPGGKYPRYLTLPSQLASQSMEDMELLKYWLTFQANRDSIAKFFTDDVPWAVRGLAKDFAKPFSYRGKPPRKSRGATGSW